MKKTDKQISNATVDAWNELSDTAKYVHDEINVISSGEDWKEEINSLFRLNAFDDINLNWPVDPYSVITEVDE